MKILFYSPVDLLNGGGCERWHCIVANALKKISKHEVKIVTGNLEGNLRWDKHQLNTFLRGICYERLDYPKLYGILLPTPFIIYKLYKEFKAADYVHFIYGFMGQDILVLFLQWLTGTPVVVGHHAPTFHASRIHNWYMKLVSRWLMNGFAAHMTLNSKDKKFFEGHWGVRNVFYLPSGIDVTSFLDMPRAADSTKLTFLAVGRLAEQKGFDLLVKGIQRFNKEFPDNNCVFNIAGSGHMEPLLKELAQECTNVHFHGFVDDTSLMNLYSTADVYILSSREEPFGLVLIEAWAAGIPIIATKTEGPRDMIKEGINGWFSEEISAEGMYKGIKDFYLKFGKSKEALALMESTCRETGRKYSIEASAQSMLDILFV